MSALLITILGALLSSGITAQKTHNSGSETDRMLSLLIQNIDILNKDLRGLSQKVNELSEKVDGVNEKVDGLTEKVDELTTNSEEPNECSDTSLPRSCEDTPRPSGSGLFTVYASDQSVSVYCNHDVAGGGWLVFLKRVDDMYNFDTRVWADFKAGFGDKSASFWLGLDYIHQLTFQKNMSLRVELEDFDGETRYAEYSEFKISSEAYQYSLTVSGYSGTAGDSISWHNGMKFSTIDRDNDQFSSIHCAEQYHGAWWHKTCYHSLLLGEYFNGAHNYGARGVYWHHWRGYNYSYKRAIMMMRPVK